MFNPSLLSSIPTPQLIFPTLCHYLVVGWSVACTASSVFVNVSVLIASSINLEMISSVFMDAASSLSITQINEQI